MGFVYFIGIVLGGLACLLILIKLTTRRLSGPITPIRVVVSANGQAEAMTCKGALSAARIWCRVRNDKAIPYAGDTLVSYEVWVREKDYLRARDVLGLG